MKLLKISSMMAAATAVGFCMSAAATGEGQSGKLELTDPVTKVNVTTTETVGGDWNTSVVPAPIIEGSGADAYFDIDCDAATSNQFNATSRTTEKVVKCSFTLQPAPVPHTGSLPPPDVDAQVAFCIATNTALGGSATLNAFVNGSGWQYGLTGPSNLTDEYTLTITFDYTGSTKYAKFSIDGVDLNNSGTVWFPVTTSVKGVQQYCFIGSGALKSISTTGQDVVAEIAPVVIDGNSVNIGIPEEVINSELIGGGSAAAAATELAKTSDNNGMTMLDNYVIFGLNNDGSIKQESQALAKADATTTGGGIKLNFSNVAAKKVSGTTIKYTLKGKEKSSDADWSTVVAATTDKDAMVIPSGTPYRIFKIEVTVDKN